MRGHMKRLGQFRCLREIRVDDPNDYEIGQKLGAGAVRRGRHRRRGRQVQGPGFAGGVKRHHFAGGPKTHGQSDRHRAPGSIGSGTTPGRVRKGLRMAGHMGDERVTVKNLRVFESNLAAASCSSKARYPAAYNGLRAHRQDRARRVSRPMKLTVYDITGHGGRVRSTPMTRCSA